MSDVLKAAVLGDELDFSALAHNAAGQAEHVVRKVGKIQSQIIMIGKIQSLFCVYNFK